jgi:hypothetical protein
MTPEMKERIMDCIVQDRARRDYQIQLARTMLSPVYKRQCVSAARIANRTAMWRVCYLRSKGAL